MFDPDALLKRIQEFERTFEEQYRRKMTEDERSILHAARDIIQQQLARGDASEDKIA
jgi:hypothetical protein